MPFQGFSTWRFTSNDTSSRDFGSERSPSVASFKSLACHVCVTSRRGGDGIATVRSLFSGATDWMPYASGDPTAVQLTFEDRKKVPPFWQLVYL